MSKRNTGLSSGIGTFTHPISGRRWTEEEVQEWWKGFLKRQECKRQKEDRSQERKEKKSLLDQVRLELLDIIHCTVCGAKIKHQEESLVEWGKRRKCDKCLSSNRKPEKVKYCRHCGQQYSFEQYREKRKEKDRVPSETSIKLGWGTWACCDSCKDFTYRIARLATQGAKRR